MEKFEVVIIGAGPAGLAAAKVLGEGGKKVAVFEKNPEIGPKICAGGLTSKSLEFGIPISLADKIFYSIKINYLGKTLKIKDNKPLVATINRTKLAQWQLQQIGENVNPVRDYQNKEETERGFISNGVKIWRNSKVVKIKNNSILLENGQKIGFDYLIGADGSLSLVRKHLNLPTKKTWSTIQYVITQDFKDLEVFFEPALFGSGYAWIFPHSNFVSIGCVPDSKFQDLNLFKNFHYWLKKMKIEVKPEAKLESFPINFDYRGFKFGNIFLVGDAAGFASGLTGGGIYPAILSGKEVAQKILNPNYNFPGMKKLFKKKFLEEKIGKDLIFPILKSQKLTQLIFKRYLL